MFLVTNPLSRPLWPVLLASIRTGRTKGRKIRGKPGLAREKRGRTTAGKGPKGTEGTQAGSPARVRLCARKYRHECLSFSSKVARINPNWPSRKTRWARPAWQRGEGNVGLQVVDLALIEGDGFGVLDAAVDDAVADGNDFSTSIVRIEKPQHRLQGGGLVLNVFRAQRLVGNGLACSLG